MAVTLKQKLGEAGAYLDRSSGSDNLYDVMKAMYDWMVLVTAEVNAINGGASIVTQFNQLLADHNALAADYSQLLADHNALSAQHSQFVTDYNGSTSPTTATSPGDSTATGISDSTATELAEPSGSSSDIAATITVE